jgi:hypothetical protein
MSVIFQLFCAEDLKQLTELQINELKSAIVETVENLQDPFLDASLVTSGLIQNRHMQRLLPQQRRTRSYSRKGATASSSTTVNISQEQAIEIPPDALDTLKKRVHDVFHQLTSELPSGPSSSLGASKLTPAELLDQLLGPADLAKLTATGKEILAWALTCELANLKAYKALQSVKAEAEKKFMEFTKGQRPKGPDSLYSPFYPLSPLYNPEGLRPNP